MARLLTRTLLAALALAPLFLPASAAANDLFTLDVNAVSPGRVIEDGAGAAYVAWLRKNPDTSQPDIPIFCKIPRGGSCTAPLALPLPEASPTVTDEPSGAFPALASGSTVVVVAPRHVDNDILVWISHNGGASFDAAQDDTTGYSNKTHPSSVVPFGPDFAISADNTGLGYSESGFASGNFTFSSTTDTVQGSSLGLDGSSNPVEAYWTQGSTYNVLFYRFDGSGATTNQTHWLGPTAVSNGYESKLSGGSDGLFLVSQDFNGGSNPSLVNVRKYGTTSFGAPVTLANDASIDLFAGGDITQATGRVAVAWPGFRAGDNAFVMRVFTSTNGGASFGPAVDVAHIGDAYALQDNAQLAVASDGGGWVTFRDSTGLHVADLSPIAPYVPPPAPYKGPTKAVTGSVAGVKLTLGGVPKNCVNSRDFFKLKVKSKFKTKKAKKKKLKVKKVVFLIGTKVVATDKKKPFGATLSTAGLPPRSTVTMKAKVTLKPKKGKKKKHKTLKFQLAIC